MYIVIEERNLIDFTRMVNQKLEEGYSLVGGVSITFTYDPNSNRTVERYYAQALIKN